MHDALSRPSPIVSRRRAHAQLVLCQGCCCGRTDRGHPEVPAERMKAAWKSSRLNRVVQLTISGCVGPCDVTNVAVVHTSAGTTWLGGLGEDRHYDALLRWAEACQAAGQVVPLPGELAARRFDWFIPVPDPPLPPPGTVELAGAAGGGATVAEGEGG